MQKLSKEEVKKIANLSRLEASDKELEFYSKELSAVLRYVDKLNELNTDEVEPKIQATGLDTILRDDEERAESKADKERIRSSIVKMFPFTHKGFIKVKAVFDKDK